MQIPLSFDMFYSCYILAFSRHLFLTYQSPSSYLTPQSATKHHDKHAPRLNHGSSPTRLRDNPNPSPHVHLSFKHHPLSTMPNDPSRPQPHLPPNNPHKKILPLLRLPLPLHNLPPRHPPGRMVHVLLRNRPSNQTLPIATVARMDIRHRHRPSLSNSHTPIRCRGRRLCCKSRLRQSHG